MDKHRKRSRSRKPFETNVSPHDHPKLSLSQLCHLEGLGSIHHTLLHECDICCQTTVRLPPHSRVQG